MLLLPDDNRRPGEGEQLRLLLRLHEVQPLSEGLERLCLVVMVLGGEVDVHTLCGESEGNPSGEKKVEDDLRREASATSGLANKERGKARRW